MGTFNLELNKLMAFKKLLIVVLALTVGKV